MIKDATFTSVWDDGIEVTTHCMVNTETKEVFDIEADYSASNLYLDILNKEYVTIDGEDYPISSDGSTEYWYD